MRLALKLTIGLVLAILPVIAVSSGVRVGREIDASEAALRDDDLMLGRTLAGAMTSVWRSAGESEARLLVDGANARQHRVAIRWVWLDGTAPPSGGADGRGRAPTVDVDTREQDAPLVEHATVAGLADGQPLAIRARRPGDAADSTVTYVAVSTPNGRRGAIEVCRSWAAEDGFIRSTIRHAATATLTVMALCGGLSFALGALLVGRPIRRLVGQARRIGAGDLSARLRLASHDELGQLGAEVDVMCDRLLDARERLAAETAARIAALEQVRHADRLATVGKLAAGIAHELGTPLNVISGHAQLITADHAVGSPDHDNATIVIDQTRRVAGIIRQLLDFARRGQAQRTPRELGPLVRDTVALLGPLLAERGVAVDVKVDSAPVRCEVDSAQLQQAITNLVVNGMQATARGGQLAIAVAGGTDVATITIADRGAGIAAEILPHIFEPFFTTKDVGAGTGLGLSVAHGIVAEHGGWIHVQSTRGAGSQFSIHLPLYPGRSLS